MPTTPQAHLRWFITLARKLLWTTPGMTLLVAAATLAAQIASLLAAFLPLKVLILLGSSHIPRYFPAIFADFDRDLLIILLTSAAGGFYLLHLVCERIITLAAERGAALLEQKTDKLHLFDDQQRLLLNAYRLFSRSASSMAFVALALFFLVWLYPLIAIWFLLLLLCGWLLGWLSGQLPWLGQHMQGERLVQIISVWSSVGFLGGFACLVVDFSPGASQGLLAALIALVLSRQMFRHSEVVIKSLIKLNERRDQYDALFISHRPLRAGGTRQNHRQLWRLLLPANRAKWLVELSSNLLTPIADSADAQLHDSGTQGVFLLHLSPVAKTDDEQPEHVLALYEKNREGIARKEAELLDAMQAVPYFPAAKLEQCLQVEDGRLHVFSLPASSRFSGLRGSPRASRQLRCQLLKSVPPPTLVERYNRSHSMLPTRLDNALIERLKLACHDGDEQRLLNNLIEQLGNLQRLLQAMPLSIMLPTRHIGPIVHAPNGQCCLLRWEHWALEPVGAGWPFAEHAVKRYAAELEEAQQCRPALAAIDAQQLYLAAVAYGFERACQRQEYRLALELLPKVLAALGEQKPTTSGKHGAPIRSGSPSAIAE